MSAAAPQGRPETDFVLFSLAMAHTCTSLLFHCIFSTKERRKAIPPDAQERLWAYMGGIARTNQITALAVGGLDDHAHLLLSLPPSMAVATAMRIVKSGSSRFLHEACRLNGFEWQEGYGAFSIGHAQIDATVAYIANQKEHHRTRDFEAELRAILEKHRIGCDPREFLG
jgi:REP element-mobilizing transposase RayT